MSALTLGAWEYRPKHGIIGTPEGHDVAVLCQQDGEGEKDRNGYVLAGAKDLLEALCAVGVYPWGYCYCPNGPPTP